MKEHDGLSLFSDETLRNNWLKQRQLFEGIRYKRLQLCLLILLVLLSSCAYFYNGDYWTKFYRTYYSEIARTHVKSDLQLAKETASTYLQTVRNPSNTENLNFNIKFEDWQAIKSTRNELIDSWHHVSDEPFRKVLIDWKGKKIKGKIRLKGIGFDHRTHEKKWSFAIKLKKNKYILGMSEFSVQNPATRKYWSECLYMKTLKAKGIIAPYCDQVEIFINGERIGVMTLTERMTTEMLESQGRKESVIFKPFYSDIWARLEKKKVFIRDNPEDFINASAQWDFRVGVDNVIVNRLSSPLDFYGEKSIEKSELLKKHRKSAVELFNGVLKAELSPSDVFDVEKTGAALAVTFLWGDFHAFQIHNLRFYFNPISFKIEPMPTDASAVGKDQLSVYKFGGGVNGLHDLLYLLSTDKKIRASFKRNVNLLARDLESGDFFGGAVDDFQFDQMQKLREDYPMLPSYSRAEFKRRLDTHIESINNDTFFDRPPINSLIGPISFPSGYKIDNPIYVYIINESNETYLQLVNTLPQSVELKSLKLVVNGVERSVYDHGDIVLPSFVPPTQKGFSPVVGRRTGELKIPLLGFKPGDNIEVFGVLSPSGQERDYDFEAVSYYSAAGSNPVSPTSLATILAENPFLKLSENKKNLVVESGEWTVSNFIKPPERVGLIIRPGVVLVFQPDAGIMLRGRLQLNGNADSPIVLKAEAPELGWAGVTVMEANHWDGSNRSIMEHVVVLDTQIAHYQSWELTGAINFYKSDVDFVDVTFDRTLAEDALNVIHSLFTMRDTKILNTRSDGFDGDFINGTISNSEFRQIGGDGIDFSGSEIDVSDSVFSGVHDKAISAGEATRLKARNIIIDGAGTGLVSKDGSVVDIKTSEFNNIEHSSLMTYMKKPQYGGAVLTADGNTIETKKLAVIVQKKSKATIDGKKISAKKVDIDKLYKEGYMRK